METRTVDLGPCHCPGTPHDHDEATLLAAASMNYGIQRRIKSAYDLEMTAANQGSDRYGGLADATLMALCTLSWNLVDENGKPRPIGPGDSRSLASIDALDPMTGTALHEAFFPTPQKGQQPDRTYSFRALTGVLLPNPSSGPSAAGPQEPLSTDRRLSTKASSRSGRGRSKTQ